MASGTGTGPRRMVLCLDGTGCHFRGTEKDTNIVKLYQCLDRSAPGQFDYYQRTYIKGQTRSKRFWPVVKSAIVNAVDRAFGTSFEDHVLAGYTFIMRQYMPGDQIYIFGFSRGAYTARFLAEMIHEAGLLSTGNDELVPFAWDTFSNFQTSRGNVPQTEKDEAARQYMEKFKLTFCRPHVGVHFLGLFDCVNSVGQFEIPLNRRSYRYIATPAAKHIRHAVSIHERRLKFKPALFLLNDENVDLKEVWFAGNHGDVGGGWSLEKGQKHLLSDIPLSWMMQEVSRLPESTSTLSLQSSLTAGIAEAEHVFLNKVLDATAFEARQRTHRPHDKLKVGHGVGTLSVAFWWLIECLPIFTRLELENGKWVPRHCPPNMGARRDIPLDAEIHPSVAEMVKAGILQGSLIPVKGGDNPNLSSVPSVRKLS
ncbi:sporulation associated protein [Phyllosticta citribraziliensis]